MTTLAPTHFCNQCGALWRQCDNGSWNLRSEKASPCCDNVTMGEQIQPLVIPPRVIGEIRIDNHSKPYARLLTAYDEHGNVWREGTSIYAAPHPQPEPTSKGSNLLPACEGELSDAMGVEWFDDGTPSDEKPASPTAGMTLADRIVHVGGRQNDQGYIEFGSYMAVNALIQHVLRDLPPSQQREPQEAAERPVSAYRREAVETIKALGYQWADGKWSAPQEASKPELKAAYTQGYNDAATEFAPKEASKVEAVADEPVRWEWRHLDTSNTPNEWSEWQLVEPRNRYTDTVEDRVREYQGYIAAGYKYELRALYLRPTQQALSDAQKRKLVGNYFADDWAIKAALSMLDDYPAVLAAAGGSEK